MTQNIAKIKRTSQAIDNFSFDEEYLMAGVIPMVETPDGTSITRQKQDYFADYKLSKFDITSSPIYMGSVNATGKCVIKRIDISGGVYEYFIADTDFDTHWTDRTSLTYVPYNQLTF